MERDADHVDSYEERKREAREVPGEGADWGSETEDEGVEGSEKQSERAEK